MQIKLGIVKEWHNPFDESCPHNDDVARDCECKRPRKRKPYRRIVVTDNGVGHRVNPNLVFEIYTNGTVALREKKRKQRFFIMASDLYSYLMQRDALKHLAAKRKAKADRKKARRARQ